MRKHLSYANVAATLALVIAVAGGSVAVAGSAKKAPKNSVKTSSIANKVITAKKLKDVKSVSQTATFTGPSGATATANCPAGAIALGGSGAADPGSFLQGVGSFGPNTGWQATAASTAGGSHSVSATVWCLPGK